MMDDKPLVSIGMVVRNEARYLSQTLDSILSQDFQSIEVVISDNASEDETRLICLKYATLDSRVSYYRNEQDLGVENANCVFRLSSGKYFMLAAGHDLWAPTYISRCVEVLEQNPSVVLCYSDAMLIDADGTPLGLMPGRVDTRHLDSLSRAILFQWGHLNGNPIYGVVRSSTLKQTRPYRYSIGPDEVVLLELSMLGEFAQIPESLYYRRRNREPETLDDMVRRYGRQPGGRSHRGYLWLPFWQWAYETLLAVKQGRLRRSHKVILALNIVFWFCTRFGRYFAKDLRNALGALAHTT